MMNWEKIFIFWVLFTPFVSYNHSYEGVKIFWLWFGSIILFAFWVVELKNKIPKYIKKRDFIFLLWILVLLFSSVKGIHPLESVIGGSYRHQGVIFFLCIWVVGKTIEMLSKKSASFLKQGVVWAGIIQSFLVLFQKFMSFFVDMNKYLINGRPIGTLGEPNAAGGFLVLSSIFIPKNKKYTTFLYLIFAISILLTQSRTSIILFFFILLYRLFPKKRKLDVKKVLFALSLVFVLSISVFTLSLKRKSSRFENRFVYSKMAVELIFQKPLIGYGAESEEVLFDKAYKKAEMPLSGLMIDRSHNLFIDILLWSGILGFGVFIYWCFLYFQDIKTFNGKLIFASFLLFSFVQPVGVVHWLYLLLSYIP